MLVCSPFWKAVSSCIQFHFCRGFTRRCPYSVSERWTKTSEINLLPWKLKVQHRIKACHTVPRNNRNWSWIYLAANISQLLIHQSSITGMAEQKKPKVGFELEKEEATYSHHGIILTIFFSSRVLYWSKQRQGQFYFQLCFSFWLANYRMTINQDFNSN